MAHKWFLFLPGWRSYNMALAVRCDACSWEAKWAPASSNPAPKRVLDGRHLCEHCEHGNRTGNSYVAAPCPTDQARP